jgi:hypothetical protein
MIRLSQCIVVLYKFKKLQFSSFFNSIKVVLNLKQLSFGYVLT